MISKPKDCKEELEREIHRLKKIISEQRTEIDLWSKAMGKSEDSHTFNDGYIKSLGSITHGNSLSKYFRLLKVRCKGRKRKCKGLKPGDSNSYYVFGLVPINNTFLTTIFNR